MNHSHRKLSFRSSTFLELGIHFLDVYIHGGIRLIQLTRALVLIEGSGFFFIIFMNFLLCWVLMISRFRFKKVKETILLWMIRYSFKVSYEFSFCFTFRLWFFSLFGSWSFFSSHSSNNHDLFPTCQKIMIPFPFQMLINFFFHFSKDYDLCSSLDLDCCFFFKNFFVTIHWPLCIAII